MSGEREIRKSSGYALREPIANGFHSFTWRLVPITLLMSRADQCDAAFSVHSVDHSPTWFQSPVPYSSLPVADPHILDFNHNDADISSRHEMCSSPLPETLNPLPPSSSSTRRAASESASLFSRSIR